MLFRGIVKKYTADLILLTKLKKIVGMKENFLQNIEVALSLTEFLLQTQESFDGFFLFDISYFTMVFRGNRTFEALSFGLQLIRLEIRMFYRECVSNLLLVSNLNRLMFVRELFLL